MLSYAGFTALLLQLVANFFHLDQPETRVEVKESGWRKEYDYLVIGAGSAGSVVAARLSELKSQQVLLMEAGDTENLVSDIPLAAAGGRSSPLDWAYKTEPQKRACLGLKGRRSSWAGGKALGGSSVLSHMLYARGNRRDYDGWARDGARGWSWRDVLPYFLKLEDETDARLLRNSQYHSSGGPQTVSTIQDPTEVGRSAHRAGRFLGYTGDDYNGPLQAGFLLAQGTTRKGSRCSTARAYLEPASRQHKNLDIITHSQATKILFNSQKRAIAVEFIKDGLKKLVLARKEIILSAGAINSPQLLMLSGIGPAEHLEELGIRVIANSTGVGQNLQDHICSSVSFVVKPGTALTLKRATSSSAITQYFTKGRGPLTILGGVEALAFVKTKFSNHTVDWPDIEFQITSSTPSTDQGIGTRRILGLADDIWDKVYKPHVFEESFGIQPVLLRPRSRGFIKLRSKDPLEYPIIDPRYLEDDRDLKVLVEGMKLALAAGLTPPYLRFNSTLFPEVVPGCESHQLWSDDYLACMVRTLTVTNYHPVGTCRMGDPRHPHSVVDSRLRVIGVQGLRVIDASVMPQIVSGNTNAPAIMIGEKGADLIKGERLKPIRLKPPKSLKVNLKRQESFKNKIIKKLRTGKL